MLTLNAAKNALTSGEHDRWLWAVPVLLALFVNLNVLSNGLGLDDEEIVQGISISRHWWDLFSSELTAVGSPKESSPYFRPLISISYRLDQAVWGYRPFGFHFSLWVAHILNTLLVFSLARRLLLEDGLLWGQVPVRNARLTIHAAVPVLSASLFAVHPVHAEAVAWIPGRSDLFCTTFLLTSFLLYLRFHRTGSLMIFGGSMLAFFFALLTKEVALGLIILFPLYEYVSVSTGASLSWKRLGARLIVPPIIVIGYYWLRTVRITYPLGYVPQVDAYSPSIVHQIVGAVGFYLKQLVFPYPHQAFITNLPDTPGLLILSGLALLCVMGILGAALMCHKLLLGIGLAWMLVFLAPGVSVAVLAVATTPVAERYLYAPSVGFLIAMTWLALLGFERFRTSMMWRPGAVWVPASLLAVIVLSVWAKEDWNRNAVWRSPLTFWQTAVAGSPESGVPYVGLAAHYTMAGRYAEAEPLLQKAIVIDKKVGAAAQSSLAAGLLNLADLYMAEGRYGEAEPLYKNAIALWRQQLGPDHRNVAISLHNLAGLYSAQQRYAEAEPLYREAILIMEKTSSPDLAKGLHNLANLEEVQGRYTEAELLYRRSLAIREQAWGAGHPAVASTLQALAELYRKQERYAEAEPLYQQSLVIWEETLGPEHAELATALESYAGLLRNMKRDAEAEKIEARAADIRNKQTGKRQ